MNHRALVPQRAPIKTMQRIIASEPQLGFPLRVLGQSRAPIVPQQVGGWWLEPFSEHTVLPPRAAARLEAVLATGITPRAIVVFHEIPREDQSGRKGSTERGADGRFTQLLHVVQRHAPLARQRLGEAAVAVSALDALVTDGARRLIKRLKPRRPIDPCLVIVTQDGDWIEVDRWYD